MLFVIDCLLKICVLIYDRRLERIINNKPRYQQSSKTYIQVHVYSSLLFFTQGSISTCVLNIDVLDITIKNVSYTLMIDTLCAE